MNFEELYPKYLDGTASEEERSFVEAEIEKAKRVQLLLEQEPVQEDVLQEADTQLVEKAKKAFWRASVRKTLWIVLSCVIGLAVLACGAIFGTALYCASDAAVYSQEEAIALAKDCVAEATGTDRQSLLSRGAERELEMEWTLTDSVYIYEVKLSDGETSYEVEVNSVSGYAHIEDIDRSHRDVEDKPNKK